MAGKPGEWGMLGSHSQTRKTPNRVTMLGLHSPNPVGQTPRRVPRRIPWVVDARENHTGRDTGRMVTVFPGKKEMQS